MTTIWKYPIPIDDKIVLSVPKGAHVLSVQVQHRELCVWLLVSPTEPLVTRTFRVAGTGHSLEHDVSLSKFIGTVQLHNGDLVFHVFDLGEG